VVKEGSTSKNQNLKTIILSDSARLEKKLLNVIIPNNLKNIQR
jgi:hypothetical protein